MASIRWMRRRLRCTCRSAVLLSLAIFLCSLYYLYVQSTCSEIESHQFISDLCDSYHRNEVAGSYCAKLCDKHSLEYERCANYRRGKVVIFMNCHGCKEDRTVKVVLKSKSRSEDTSFPRYYPSISNTDNEEKWKNYYSVIQEAARLHFISEFADNISQHKDVLSFAWGWDYFKFVEESKIDRAGASSLAYKTIVSLLEQSEYLLSRYLHNKTYIPKIYGTCGQAYFVEYIKTLHTYEFELGFWKASSWKERAGIALRLIDLVRHLERDFKVPLHLCDVKADNFGRRTNSELAVIDSDCAFFDSQLRRQFFHSNCSDNSDCDFFDCRGYCNTTSGKCRMERTNNNIQTVCEDVFQGFIPKLPTGLLRDPPEFVREDLIKTLEKCSYPDLQLERHSSRHPTPDETIKKLEEIIHLSLK